MNNTDWWIPKDISPEMAQLLRERMAKCEELLRELVKPHIQKWIEEGNQENDLFEGLESAP